MRGPLPEHTLITPDGKSVLPDAIDRAVRLPCCVLWLDKDGDNLGGTGGTANKLGVGMVHTGNTTSRQRRRSQTARSPVTGR